MSNPLISYVVTSYNIQDFIRESIECAFAQTYSPLEIVLSDDCSSDKTFEIMKEMTDSYKGPHKIILNRNKKNLGITRHMNKAYLELANGEIIIAAHGDDISIPDRTFISYEFLKKYPDVTAVSLSTKSVDQNGKLNRTDDAQVKQVKFYDFVNSGNIPAPSRAFYKKVMTTFGPLSSDCPTEDELITTRALMLGRNAFLPNIGVFYRKHKGSSSNPENFSKFPLQKIYEQQERDIKLGVDLDLISAEVAKNKLESLRKGIIIRDIYRNYFANPTFIALIKLIWNPIFGLRTKIHFIKDHHKRSLTKLGFNKFWIPSHKKC